MKKTILFALAASITLAGAGCSRNEKEKEKNLAEETSSRDIKFESYTYDLIGEFTGNDTIPVEGSRLTRFIGQGVLPQDIGDTDIHKLRETLINLSGIHFEDGNAEPILPDSVRITDLAANDTDACAECISTLTTTLVTPRAIVWENVNYAYACRAAHGNTTTKYVNFCLDDGKIVSLSALFKKNYRETLLNLIRNKIKDADYQLLVPIDQVEIPSQFGLTSKGIIFSYDPYQIAPYSEGTIQVELSAGELYDILNAHGLYILLGIKEQK